MWKGQLSLLNIIFYVVLLVFIFVGDNKSVYASCATEATGDFLAVCLATTGHAACCDDAAGNAYCMPDGGCYVYPTPTDGWTCFPAGTKVLMGGGTQKNIEDVKVGDQVVGQSEDGKRSVSKVTKLDQPIRDHMCQVNFTDGSNIKLTNEHPLFTAKGWRSINPRKTFEEVPNLPVLDLKKGDKVLRSDDSQVEVASYTCWSQKIQTYNLILEEGTHTYFADGLLAHNKNAQSCPAGQEQICPNPPTNDYCNVTCIFPDRWTGSFVSCGTSATTGLPKYWCSTCYCGVACTPVCNAPLCGQSDGCGGVCSSSDNGSPTTAVTVVSPSGTSVNPTITDDQSPTLLWQSSGDSLTDRYLVEYLNSSGVGETKYVTGIGKTGTVITDCLQGGETYHWRVRPENTSCGTDAGPWSGWKYFQINSPSTVTVVTPDGTNADPTMIDDKTPTLIWQSSGDSVTDQYLVEYLDSSGVGETKYVTGIGKTGTVITSCLVSGDKYHWRVRAENTTCGSDVSPWSGWKYFQINLPPAVTIVTPNGTSAAPTIVSDSTPNLIWNRSTGTLTDRYLVELVSSTGVGSTRYVNGIGSTGLTSWVTLPSGEKYHWRVRGEDSTCGLGVGPWSGWAYVKLNTSPTIGNLQIKNNAAGSVVAWDSGSRGQICNSGFANSSAPRMVTFSLSVTDPDGYGDISLAKMRWNGTTYNMAIGVGSGLGTTATVSITHPTSDNGTASLPIYFDVKDALTVGDPAIWVDSTYSWKVWDCNVTVSGNMYDSSSSVLGAQCPTGEGFSNLAPASMNFNYADFTPTIGTLARINATNDNSYGNGALTWGKTYTAAPNTDIVGGTVINRWIDLGVGTTNCGAQLALNSTVVDPYEVSPAIKVDFSTTLAQVAWYQVLGGGIQAAASVTNMIPTTCGLDATCVGAITKTNNSMVSAASISNGGCVLGSSECQYGNPNNWYRAASTLSSAEKYDYRYFYDKYFIGYGGGITLPANATMTSVKAVGGTGVFFIDGDFDVNEDNLVSVGKSLLIIAKGTIFFDQGVSQSQGIFIANDGMLADGVSNSPLLVSGSLYSPSSNGDITLTRSFVDPLENNTNPAVLVSYRPDMIFNLPGSFLKVLSGWRQN